MGPLAPLLIGAGAGILGNIFSASQANRFSERMSSTAHQREVEDLRRAGLNPMLSANRGASAPQGASPDVTEGASRGVSSALGVQQQKAQIEVLKAQAESLRAGARSSTAGAMRTEALTPRDLALLEAQIKSADISVEQARELLPMVLERARQEIQLTVASARRANAVAMLDELAKSGSVNLKEFEERIGEAGPWVKLFLNMMREARGRPGMLNPR